MLRLSTRLSPRINSLPKKGAAFDIGGMHALKLGQEFRQAREWFDALSELEQQDWLTIARSENVLNAWHAFRSKCK